MAEEFPLFVGDGAEGAIFLPESNVPRKSSLRFNSGFHFPLEQSVTWGFQTGTAPQTLRINMLREYAEKLVKEEGSEVSLTMSVPDASGDDLKEITFEGLRLLLRPPADHWKDGVYLVDDRWNWPRVKVTKAWNVTRKSNDQIAVASIAGAGRNLLLQARRYYRENTLLLDPLDDTVTERTPGNALDLALDVLIDDLKYSPQTIVPGGEFKTLREIITSEYVPSNIWTEGEPADALINRFLNLGGLGLYLDEKKRIVLYNRQQPFTEKDFAAVFRNGLPPKSGGNLFVVNYEPMRPSEIEVQSRVEKELLFTHVESGAQTTSSLPGVANTHEEAAAQIEAGQVIVENVTRTIFSDQVPGLPRGTVVPIEEALAAFGTQYGAGPLTIDDLRRHYGSAAAAFASDAIKNPLNINEYTFDPRALLVWQAISKDYRSLFRIPQVVLDQLLSYSPVLVDVLNEQTGSRAPAEVFSTATWHVDFKYRVADEVKWEAAQSDSFRDENGNALSPFNPLPAEVGDIDVDLGLYRVAFLQDMRQPGTILDVLPGRPVDANYNIDVAQAGLAALGRDSLYSAQGLEADWECSVVMSCVPFTPNNHRRLYRERFKPNKRAADGLGNSKGTMISVFQNADTARFALPPNLDNYRSPNRLGAVGEEAEHEIVVPTGRDLDSNLAFGEAAEFVNRQMIRAIGLNEAARVYTTWIDQLEGDVTLMWTSGAVDLRPIASLTDIAFTYEPSGKGSVQVRASRLSQPADLANLLPEKLLRQLGRQIAFEPGR